MKIANERFYIKPSALEEAASKVVGMPVRLHTSASVNNELGGYQAAIVWEGENDTFALAARTFLHHMLLKTIKENRERLERERKRYFRENEQTEHYYEDCLDALYARYLEENLQTLRAQFSGYLGDVNGATWHRAGAEGFAGPTALAKESAGGYIHAAVVPRAGEAWKDEGVRRYYERQIEYLMMTVLRVNFRKLARIFYVGPEEQARFPMSVQGHELLARSGAVIGLYGRSEGLENGWLFLDAAPYPGGVRGRPLSRRAAARGGRA